MEKFINVLERLQTINDSKDQKEVTNEIADVYKEMGFSAISEEIANNRQAKRNALFGLKMFCESLSSARYNTDGEIIHEHSNEYLTKVESFKNAMTKLINTFLTDGNDKQREYLKLKNEYDNEYYKLGQIGGKMDYVEIRGNREEWLKLYDLYKDQTIAMKKAKNKLDQFVLKELQ